MLNTSKKTVSCPLMQLLLSELLCLNRFGLILIASSSHRTDAPWGIARISQNARLSDQNTGALTFTYRSDSSAGAGVDIYVVGTYTIKLPIPSDYNVPLQTLVSSLVT